MRRLLYIFLFFPLLIHTASAETEDTLSLSNRLSSATPAEQVSIMIEISTIQRVSHPDRALYWANKALEQSQRLSIGELTAESYYTLGYLHYTTNNFEPALEDFKKAEKIYNRLGLAAGVSKVLNRIGNVFQLKGAYPEALQYYNQALSLNRSVKNDGEIARSLTNISSIDRLFGNYTGALELSLEALDLYEKVDDKAGIAWSALNIARLFRISNEPNKALEYLNRSLGEYRHLNNGKGDINGITLCLTERAAISLQLGKIDEAYVQNLLVYLTNISTGNLYGASMAKGNIGIILYKLGRYTQAEKSITAALKIKTRIGDSLDLAALYRYQGLVKIKTNHPKESIAFFNEAEKIAQRQNLKQDKKDIFLAKAIAYSQIGNLKEAIRQFVKFSSLRDSLNRQQVTRMEEKYAMEKRIKENELQQQHAEELQHARLQRQRLISVAIGVGLLLSLALAVVLLKRNEEKRKTNLLLEAKNQAILNQKEEIETQRDELKIQHEVTTLQRDQIADQQKVITDSIRYAGRIQTALMPSHEAMMKIFTDYFIIYKPKSFVSGDFFWVSHQRDIDLFAAADCTGHGVPGAFMSLLGISSLNELVARNQLIDPASILNLMRDTIVDMLHQTGSAREPLDGIDMALCAYNREEHQLHYAGAYNSLLLVRNSQLESPHDVANLVFEHEGKNLWELKGQKMPIGHHPLMGKSFETRVVTTLPGDIIYLMSDGFGDQMGGAKGAKFLQQNLKRELIALHAHPMEKQKEVLEDMLKRWMGDYKQVDDILLMGLSLG